MRSIGVANRGIKGYRGDQGEDIVRRYLSGKGYVILAVKYRSPYGEIDIVALDGGYMVFIEVKYRKTLAFGLPRESVNAGKQAKIKKTALCYIAERQPGPGDFRFDVIEIYGGDSMRIEHIEDAFQ